MGILEVPRNDRDFEDKSENDEVAQEDNVEEGNHYGLVNPGNARGAVAPGISVNPISTREAYYAPTSLLAPPDF